jgi:biopolymer transport protein ExbD
MFFRRRNDDGLQIELPITPMLDMAFQLLIFFIFTYHPSELEGQLPAVLPATNGSGGPGEIVVDGPPEPLDATILVHVRTQHEQQAGGIVFPITIEQDHALKNVDSLKELEKNLQQRYANAPKAKVRIVGDDKLKWACMMQVVDVCQDAGFQQVGFGRPSEQ